MATDKSTSKEWYESWFNSDLYDIMYQHRDLHEAESFLHRLLEFLGPNENDRFLDLACGTGRHARVISQQGYPVTGIDLSARKIDIASRASNDGLEFFVQDMRKPFRINYYDFVINLFTSFGYFENIKDNHRVLRSVRSSLKSDGCFVLDYFNAEWVLKELVNDEVKHFGDWKVEINKKVIADQLVKTMFWSNGEINRTYTEKVSLFKQEDFEEMLTQEGFTIKHIFGDYYLNEFNHDSPRLILIASC